MPLFRSLPILAVLVVAACRIETRPPAEVARTQATVQAAVAEHYRARNALMGDSLQLTVTRRQVDVRRDIASVWVTLRERRLAAPDSVRDTTRYEHLLLRRTAAGWTVLNSAPVSAP
ncbi:MAG TPA: hypothetical protein VG712_07075 [Gemmatimonadales bacterium]|nr:hypothetical protein [Gemmatimonadales bacterium]